MGHEYTWTGAVAKQSQELLGCSSLYRQVTVQSDADATAEIQVDRAL